MSSPIDPAARGLDVFVELPTAASSGAKLSINLRTFGFPTAVEPLPLAAVKVEAAWEGSDAPPVSIVSDADGVATLPLIMPEGTAETASFMLALTYGEHRRTKKLELSRSPKLEVELRLEEQEVVPGSNVPMWVTVRDLETGAPAPQVDLVMNLFEGGVVRQTTSLRTDATGSASAVVAIPEVDDATFNWHLSVDTVKDRSSGGAIDLRPREDVPAQPTLVASFEGARLPAGSKTNVHVRLTSATGQGIAHAEVSYLFTDEGKDAEATDERWKKDGKVATTDQVGEVVIPYAIPTVGFATKKRVAVRAMVEGRQREAASTLDVVAKIAPSVELLPESDVLIPGVDERILVRVKDGWDKPIGGLDLRVEGDGLTANVKTDARGVAELHWKLPKDIGAARKVGPCSGGVAATVNVTAVGNASPELLAAGAVPKCLNVDRSRKAIIRPAALVVRSGESMNLEVALADSLQEAVSPKKPASVSLSGSFGTGASSQWVKSATAQASVPISAGGVFIVSANLPGADGAAIHAETPIVVKPRILPKLTARVAGGRLAPGGEVEVEAKLTDETGAPLQGSVTGILYDKFSRPDDKIPPALDTRLDICEHARIEAADCDAVLAGDPALMPLLRAALSSINGGSVHVASDPGGSAKEEMRHTFNEVLKNLEGAVFESTGSAETLRDVLRKTPKGNTFNPEILTLVTAALSNPPTTPGGEPFTLEDLRALDAQVDYDHVARRVTRLKMFRILAAVRAFRNTQDLDANEPVLQDPNAILRRLFEEDESGVDQDALRDPWGGAMEFVKAGGPGLPFINALPGWELHAPGPDGRVGTADDIKDPFARVVKSGSPYARAMGEDKIVDSRLDMRVGEETVSKWTALLNEFTGTELSTGDGFGSGHGRLGGSHRSKAPSIRMGATRVTRDKSAYIESAPVRTDKDGIARLKLTLGSDETTYRVLLVGLPDNAGPAASTVDVVASLPLSVRIDGGTKWIQGDAPIVNVRVTNRQKQAVQAKLHLSASGSAELGQGEASDRPILIGPESVVTLAVRARARTEGEARIGASIKGGGLDDSIEHRIDVAPNGHRMTLARSRWVSSDVIIDVIDADDITKVEGPPSLLLEGSFDPTLSAIMEALKPDRLSSSDSAADAIEVFERLRRNWLNRSEALAKRADAMREQAVGRFVALTESTSVDHDAGVLRRVRFWLAAAPGGPSSHVAPVDECPVEHPGSDAARIREVEGEPGPVGGSVTACWDAAVTAGLRAAKDAKDPVMLARLLLAFADRPHRESLASEIAPELANMVSLKATGEITLNGALTEDRSARAIVYAALVRATGLGYKPIAPEDTLVGWLLVQRAPDGSFGSTSADRGVVEALGSISDVRTPRTALITELDAKGDAIGSTRQLRVTADTHVTIDRRTKHVAVHLAPLASDKPGKAAPGILVRLLQPVLRSFSFRPGPRDLSNPLSVEVKWPRDASTESPSSLEVRFATKAQGVHRLIARIPLLPGASLAEPVEGVRQINGALLVSTEAGESSGPNLPMLVPLRFALGGEFTVPEANVRDESDDALRARALATHVHVARNATAVH